MMSMRLELEMLDQKVKRMMKAFETSCKIKGNTSCDDIIKVATHHIEMKNRYRLIQHDLQVWPDIYYYLLIFFCKSIIQLTESLSHSSCGN